MKLQDRCVLTRLALPLLVFVAAPVLAGTSGQLTGVVTEIDGTPLPGVRIAASSPSQIGGIQLADTGVDGRFQYPRLSPGEYSVRIELDGFLTQELTGVQVRLDRLTELRVALPIATFGDEVEVVEATPVVDPEQVSTGQTFTAEYLQEAALGMANRYYLGMLNQTAGAVQRGFGVRVFGSTPRDNNFLIDGMDTTDPYDQYPSFGSVSFEAVDEVAFHTGGFEAEYGRAIGGVVNLVTKSGGNRLRGSVDFRYADSDFQESGEHFDPEAQPTKASDTNASLGGPFIRDRLWFFTAVQNYLDDFTPTGAPTTREWSEQNYLGKLTWQASPNWSLVGKVIANPIDWQDSGSNQFRAADATWHETWDVLNGQLETNGVLSDSLLFGLRVGGQRSSWDFLPQDGDLTTIAHFNLDSRESYGNGFDQNADERTRAEIDSDASWFVDDFGGAHDLKAGLKYTESGYFSNWCYVGSGERCAAGVEGFYFRDILGEEGQNLPAVMWVNEALGGQSFDGSIWSLYAQDAWRIRPDLTLKAGLRWDSSRQTNDVGREIADLGLLQPRLGVAWDIRGNGRNLLRASWGRYMHPSALQIAEFTTERGSPYEIWLSCSTVGPWPVDWDGLGLTDPAECAEVAAAEGLGYRTDQEGWDPAGWYLFPDALIFAEPGQTAPDLEAMYADELIVAYERELFRRTALEVSYVKKETRNVIEDTCSGNLPVPTEGADCSTYVVANLPGLSKDYEGLIVRLESRAHDRLHFIASYVLSDSKGVVPGRDTSAAFDIYPYHFVNQYGYLPDHSRHRVKLNGFVILPLDFSVAINSEWSSEFRWAPTTSKRPVPYGEMLLEPRGNRSEPGPYRIDLQIGKAFDLGRTRLKLFGTVYNVLDTEIATWVCENDSGCGEYELGEPTNWQQPRRYELGVRVEF